MGLLALVLIAIYFPTFFMVWMAVAAIGGILILFER